jgi:hypothetical protein
VESDQGSEDTPSDTEAQLHMLLSTEAVSVGTSSKTQISGGTSRALCGDIDQFRELSFICQHFIGTSSDRSLCITNFGGSASS